MTVGCCFVLCCQHSVIRVSEPTNEHIIGAASNQINEIMQWKRQMIVTTNAKAHYAKFATTFKDIIVTEYTYLDIQ